jgi:hypothetical protein
MQNFREKYAYKISLYFLIVSLFWLIVSGSWLFGFGNFISSEPIGVDINFLGRLLISIIFVFSPFHIFLIASFFRYISLEVSKSWKDIILFFVSIVFNLLSSLLFIVYSSGNKKLPVPGFSDQISFGGKKEVVVFSFSKMFDFSSPYSISKEVNFLIIVCFVISIILSIKYLLELRKRDKEAITI